ncbi:MAG: rhodanese-like domain-containing protein [Desulfobulbaceae bacterium]|nr:rhodanese-like domain-containing protein [Desulfobulbaceae bacterium]
MAKLMILLPARYVLPLIFLLFFLGGCAPSINSSVLLARLGNEKDAPAVVDVRTGSEFKRGHLPGAVNISLLVLPFRLATVPVKGKGDPVVVYCAHGPRAALAAFILRMAGFKDVLHLRGDLAGWKSSGLSVE